MLEFSDIEAAAERIQGHAVATPLINQPSVDQQFGRHLLLKAENLQRTGSFKFRGAFNAVCQVSNPAGVVACSSGNHAQGLACAAAIKGIPAAIVMPSDAPQAKIEGTKAYGASVILYDRDRESREAIALEHASTTGAEMVWPYDDYRVMAGQGTVGLETINQCGDLQLDALLVCCGGGGLTAGVATAAQAMSPATRVYTVEPEGFDDHARSFASQSREQNKHSSGSICDALLAPEPGELTFEINRRLVTGGLVVSDQEVIAAMQVAFQTYKLVLEPGGAAALAAALFKPELAGLNVGVTLTGGNVDPQMFATLLST